MASFVSDSIFAALKAQFEDAMRNLVVSIAEGEGLDTQQLMDKYLVNVIPEAKAKKAPAKTRKAKVSVTPIDPDETQDPNAVPMPTACSCLTAKGGACKLKPLFGTAMCSIHTKKAEAAASAPAGAATGPIKRPKKKAAVTREEPVADDSDSEEEAIRPVAPKKKRAPAKKKAAETAEEGGAAAGSDDEAGPSAPAAPKKAPKKAKKVKSDAPVHTHELDGEVHPDCELCQTHGCPLEDNEDEYETVMSPPRTLRERLARAAAMDEFVEDDE